jgi:hypothetical protein
MKLILQPRFLAGHRPRSAGVALIIVLAFVVILTGVILAFFSRALASRQISNASASQTKVELFAEGATDTIIANLQQEIAMSSSSSIVTTGSVTNTIFIPLTPASMLPQISGTTTSVPGLPPNLLVRSAGNYGSSSPTYFYYGTNGTVSPSLNTTGSISSNAINVSSTTPSLNGRYISNARWNEHYFLPLLSNSDSTPVTPANATNVGPGTTGTDSFVAPDWVLVARNGTNPTSWNSNMINSSTNGNTVVGRYAYGIYHEGGLLDVNTVGYPMINGSNSLTTANYPTMITGTQMGYKSNLAFADITQLPGINSLSTTQQQNITYALVGWRNYATAQPATSSTFPNYTFTSSSNYYNFALSGSNNTLAVPYAVSSGSSPYNNGTDHRFISRQELIQFVKKGLGGFGLTGLNLNVLNYLTTFSRGLNLPSIAPDLSRPPVLSIPNGGNNAYGLDNQINPNFLSLRAASAFTRNNGATAVVGEPYVNKRFSLAKLAWLTYLGPSATRPNLKTPSSAPGNKDYDLWQLENLYGVSSDFLAQGTAANIKKYFGLVWQSDTTRQIPAGFHDGTNKWFYEGYSSGTSGAINRLSDLATASTREPNFFELLKGAIAIGSKAKSSINLNGASGSALFAEDPYRVETLRDQSLDYAIIQLGANIIDQSKCDGYVTRIVFNDGTTQHEFRGVINQPYIYRVSTGTLKLRTESGSGQTPALFTGTNNGPSTSGTVTDDGVAMVMQNPTIWNPHDLDAPIGNPAPTKFRIVADSCPPEYEDATGNGVGYYEYAGAGFSRYLVASTQGSKTGIAPFSDGPNGTGALISTLIDSSNPDVFVSSNLDQMTFTTGTNPALFYEPTILARPNCPAGSNLTMVNPGGDYAKIQNSAGKAAFQTNLGFLCDTPDPLNLAETGISVSATTTYMCVPIGVYPVAWINGGHYYRSFYAGIATSNAQGIYVTYRLQYQDSNQNNNWITYDEKYVYGNTRFLQTVLPAGSSGAMLNQYGGAGSGANWESFWDPRTSRFCAITGLNLGSVDNAPGSTANDKLEWLSAQNDVLLTERPDANDGYAMSDDRGLATYGPEFSNYADAGFHLDTTPTSFLRQGLFCQNNPSVLNNGLRFVNDSLGPKYADSIPQYYSDPDGVVRFGASAYVAGSSSAPATTTIGLPMATAYPQVPAVTGTQGLSRPYFLHRPFRSVAELGYVFSDTPWKNIDFFTPQSGDTALLDLFTAYETPDPVPGSNPLIAGVVNLNTRQSPVLQSILSGAYVDEVNESAMLGTKLTHPITGAEAAIMTSSSNPYSLISRTSSISGTSGPLVNLGDLVGRWVNPSLPGVSGTTYTGFSSDLTNLYASVPSLTGSLYMQNIQRLREAAIRPLSNVGNTRVWNLLIDVVAQTGRYPQNAQSAANFLVEGEQRYWVHVAIDRFTGQVLDKQVEVVKE